MTTDHTELRLAAARAMPKQIINTADLLALINAYDALLAAGQPKRKAAAKKAATAPVGALPAWMPLEAWEAFLAMRVKIKKPATEYAQRLLVKKLAQFVADGHDPLVVLERSITQGWQDLYAPQGSQRQQAGGIAPAAGWPFPASSQGRQPFAQQQVADQRAANSAAAKARLLGQRPPQDDDGMTFEMA